LIPILYLKGISTSAMPQALEPLLGPKAAGLSPATIVRLIAGLCKHLLALWRFGRSERLEDFLRKVLVNFAMTWHRLRLPRLRLVIDVVLRTVSQQSTSTTL
jgi:hypothetical protein